MRIRPHALADAAAFERSLLLYEEHTQNGLRLLARGEGDTQAICRQGLRFSIWNACIVLVLGRGEEAALRYFRQALACGLLALGAPGSKNGLRAYDVLMEVGDIGSRIIQEHERRSAREPRILSIADYSGVLEIAACFGDQRAMEEVARYPEERYGNPNVIAGEDYYGYLRAWKRLLLRDNEGAKEEMQAALDEDPQPVPRKDMEAFVVLLEGDRPAFTARLEERLNGHKKQYQKQAGNPEGFICLPALMLCRAAIDQGMAVEEWPYVPVRLLPNYRG